MEPNVYEYAQQDFNLPHDLVPLPSGGVFYNSKKKGVKIGYLTAVDENILLNSDSRKTVRESIILPLLRNKLYERDIRPEELLEGDVEAILIYLRNTSFGPEYNVTLTDPQTGKQFSASILLDELNIKKPNQQPNEDGTFTVQLPKSKTTVKLRLLSLYELIELDRIIENYPSGRVAPVVTMKLERMIRELDGSEDRVNISKFSEGMPIADSKFIRKFIQDNEPRLDLLKEVIAPSGERVMVNIAFGVEFFRPFF